MTEKIKKATTPKKPRATASKEAAPKTAAPKRNATKGNVTQMVSPEEIARLAHQYWAERGHQHGHGQRQPPGPVPRGDGAGQRRQRPGQQVLLAHRVRADHDWRAQQIKDWPGGPESLGP